MPRDNAEIDPFTLLDGPDCREASLGLFMPEWISLSSNEVACYDTVPVAYKVKSHDAGFEDNSTSASTAT